MGQSDLGGLGGVAANPGVRLLGWRRSCQQRSCQQERYDRNRGPRKEIFHGFDLVGMTRGTLTCYGPAMGLPAKPAVMITKMQHVNVGVIGLGNVGSGTLAVLADNADQIALKLGFRLRLPAVCSR